MPSPTRSAHPKPVDEIILADDPATVAHQINRTVEHLGLSATNSAPRHNSRRSVSSM
jgi:hypothetical protein